MFSRMAKSGAGPEFVNQPIEMFKGGFAALLGLRLTRRAAVIERARYRADQPWRANRRAPDHHPRRARNGEHSARVFQARAIPIDDDRDRDRADNRAGGSPVGAAVIELGAGPPMNGHHLRSRSLGPSREFWRV